MKLFIFCTAAATLFLSASECNKKKASAGKMKARLEVAGICMNYTIGVIEGKVDTSLIASNWTDETTNKTYSNVFRLKNHCDFPDSIKQGNEFYFVIDSSSEKQCPVCLAYYPTPSKALAIKVVE